MILLQLGFKAAEKRESVGGRPGKSCQNLVLIQPADFLGGVLNHALAKRDLAVSGHNHLAIRGERHRTVVERIRRFFGMRAIVDYSSAGQALDCG